MERLFEIAFPKLTEITKKTVINKILYKVSKELIANFQYTNYRGTFLLLSSFSGVMCNFKNDDSNYQRIWNIIHQSSSFLHILYDSAFYHPFISTRFIDFMLFIIDQSNYHSILKYVTNLSHKSPKRNIMTSNSILVTNKDVEKLIEEVGIKKLFLNGELLGGKYSAKKSKQYTQHIKRKLKTQKKSKKSKKSKKTKKQKKQKKE